MNEHPIFNAIQNGDQKTVREMLATDLDLNLRNEFGNSMLHWAVLARQTEILRILLEAGADPNAEDEAESRGEPLNAAALAGECEMIRLLLKAGAEVNHKDFFGRTPLNFTTWRGQLEAARLLMEAGAKELPFKDAADHGFMPLLELFLGHESVTGEDWEDFGFSPLHTMVILDEPCRAKKWLDEEELTSRDVWGFTPLHWAAGLGRTECMNLLMEAGVDLEAETPRGARAINFAIRNRQKETTRLLLDAGVELDFEPSPIAEAALANDLTILKALLEVGADPNFKQEEVNQSPLTFAVEEENLEAAKLLVQYGADVNPKTSLCFTPFYEAICSSSPEMARFLLESGVDPNTTDEDGYTLLEAAKDFDETEIIRLLKEAGAKDEGSV